VSEGRKYWWEEQGGLRFECVECGRCCGVEPGSVWVSDEEQARIARYLCIDAEELRKKYLVRRLGRVSLREKDNLDCVFYERNSAHCMIYKVRPRQCSLFPFWPSLLEDEKIWNYYAARCQGMNHGKLYTKEMIDNIDKNGISRDL
jgi:Fe-S-cluster containining protein